MTEKNIAYLLLGGNIGDVGKTFLQTKQCIREQIGDIIAYSAIYESEPWGFEHEQQFLNQAICIETGLNPQELLNKLLTIETSLGRIREVNKGYKGRTIDIDILLFNDLVVSNDNLSVPHPKMPFRRFVLLPLSEIAGDLTHPTLNASITKLLTDCKDQLQVKER